MANHVCKGETAIRMHGGALSLCEEDDDGTLWVSNQEYASQVNYCPYCGYPARVKAATHIYDDGRTQERGQHQ